ncbi:lytic murein transglycosylase [Rhizobium ruizarguesonis]|uniref:lytic murein transglycosylase n=1 Tax=Rhizobium ruizarguesonis TaxID=2081791 RepID=UPI001FE1FA71|nr:lytic murein transglycosylase [Rhizobium ruizarguesonis]
MGFIFGGDTGQSQADVTDARKRLAAAMLQQGTDTSPIQSPWEGAARMAQALMGGLAVRKQGELQSAADAQVISAITGQPYTPPEKPAGFLSSIFGGNKTADPGATGSSMPKVDSAGNVAAPTTVQPGGNPEVAEYIRQASLARGIDPNYSLRVAGHEGLNVFDPSSPDHGGDEGSSFGPFQLHYAGRSKSMPNPGLGDEFTKATGLHASDPSTWKQQIDFSLDWARKHGWSPWMGAKAEGITGMMGIGNAPPQQQAAAGMPSAPPIQPPPVNPPAPAPTPGYVDPMVAPRAAAAPMPQAGASGEVASLDPSIGIPMPGAAGQMRASAPAQPIPPPGAPQAALPPLPTSTVGPTPNVASQPPVGMPSSQIPPEFQNSPQLMNADPNKGILQAILGGTPASQNQVVQAQALGQNQQPPQARLAQALDGASPQQAANPMANPRSQALVQAIMNPNASPQVKAMAAQSLQTLMKPPEYGFQTLPDGTVLRSDPRTGTVQPIYQSTPKPTEVNGRLVGADGKVIADFSNGQWERLSDGTLYNKSTGEFRQAPGGAGGEKYYGATVPYYDKDGNLRYRQLSDKGGGKDLDFGPGSTAAPTTRTVDTGTELITLGPGGQEVKRTTKENYAAAKDTAQGSTEGKAAGDAVSSLPADLMQADQTIKNIDQLLTSKGLDSIVGSVDQFRPSWTMGADGRDALTRLKQLQGGAFLQAYGLLKGGGQITEVEGGKAQDAMARMDRSLDEPHFRAALKDFRDAVEQGVAKMKERAKVAAPSAPSDPAVVPTDVPGVTIRRRQ